MTSTLSGSGEALRLVSILEQQLALYDRLRKLSLQQSALISQGLADQLASVLAQRQELLDQAAVLSARIEAARANSNNVWFGIPDEHRTHIETLLRQLQELMVGIMRQDDMDQQELSASRARPRRYEPQIHIRATMPAPTSVTMSR